MTSSPPLPPSSDTSQTLPRLCVTRLAHRTCLRLYGTQAREFLQRLVTNDVMRVTEDRAVYALLLTPQGKFRADMLITLHPAGGMRLDVARDSALDLVRILERHRLNADVKIEILDTTTVWTAWMDNDESRIPASQAHASWTLGSSFVWFDDPRHPWLGKRGYTMDGSYLPPASFTVQDLTAWDVHRLTLGIPDGNRDLIVGSSTVTEGNLDLVPAVDWKKGCYVGQELTARMHWRGLAKRRLALLQRLDGTAWPTHLSSPSETVSSDRDAPVYDSHGAVIATLRSTSGAYALALMAVENRPQQVTLQDGCVVLVTTLHQASS